MSALHLFASNYQSVYNRRGEFINMQTHFAGKKLGLLFSASWCKPCREMTPQIMKYYEQNNGGKDFDIVFVSGDNDEMSFQRYYATMPWLALNFNESQINVSLLLMFNKLMYLWVLPIRPI